MSLLERLNLFARVRNLEEKEAEMLSNFDDLLTGVEYLLDSLDERSLQIEQLNQRIGLMLPNKSLINLDIEADLDVV